MRFRPRLEEKALLVTLIEAHGLEQRTIDLAGDRQAVVVLKVGDGLARLPADHPVCRTRIVTLPGESHLDARREGLGVVHPSRIVTIVVAVRIPIGAAVDDYPVAVVPTVVMMIPRSATCTLPVVVVLRRNIGPGPSIMHLEVVHLKNHFVRFLGEPTSPQRIHNRLSSLRFHAPVHGARRTSGNTTTGGGVGAEVTSTVVFATTGGDRRSVGMRAYPTKFCVLFRESRGSPWAS